MDYNDYLEYHNSYHKDTYAKGGNYFTTTAEERIKLLQQQWDVSLDPTLSFEKEAKNSYLKAEVYLKQAIKNDSSFYDAYTTLAGLYEENGEYQKGLDIIKQLRGKKVNDYGYHATLALLYYRLNENESAYEEFQKFISLMPLAEKDDYLVGSVKILLQSFLGENKSYSTEEINYAINNYWNSKDPLVLTDINERLLEHFARVTYANLKFSVESTKTKGWKTDRGEILIRYGFPNKRIRYRPYLEPHGIRILKTDVWEYNDFTLAFTDQFLTNQFQFSSPYSGDKTISQFPGNTDDLVKLDLRNSKPEVYNPNLKGPIFTLPYKAYQFASSDKNKTDVYVGYQINFDDTSTTKEQFEQGYDAGLFFNDRNFNRKYEKKETNSKIAVDGVLYRNSLYMQVAPQSGNLAFEMMRKKDKGVASYHGKFNVRSFKADELQLSDLVFANKVELETKLPGSIQRKNISVIPNPTNQFANSTQLFLYYEIYNLKTKNSITDFEQIITLQKKGGDGVLGSVLSVVGLDGKGNKVMLSSNYQTQEQDTQMYIQIDMGKYEPGSYQITVTIKDKYTGKTVSANSEIEWRER
jgi:GWxTD domain-containing protein